MINLEQIKTVIEKVLSQYQMKLTDIRWISQPQPTLEISVMDETFQFDLDQAERISEPISTALDEANLIDFPYMLDIGSPGAERVLSDLQDMIHHVNQYVYAKLIDPKAGQDHYEGYLRSVNEDTIEIEYREKTRKKLVEIKQNNLAFIRLAVKL